MDSNAIGKAFDAIITIAVIAVFFVMVGGVGIGFVIAKWFF